MTHTEDQISVGPVHQPEGGLGRLITCSVDQLHPHPSFVRHNLVPATHELSVLAERGELAFREPLTITQDHSILDGYAKWHLACLQGRTTLPCLQFDLSGEEALLWLLQKQRRSAGLNAFSRVLLALELEPWFKARARSNQQVGGHLKGSSNLTEADKLDVRSEIAAAAGVSVGNVSKVKHLTSTAHPDILEALRCGGLRIHRAWKWRKDSLKQQQDAWSKFRSESGIKATIRHLISKHRSKMKPMPLGLDSLLSALSGLRTEERLSILTQSIKIPGWAVFISEELLRELGGQLTMDLNIHHAD